LSFNHGRHHNHSDDKLNVSDQCNIPPPKLLSPLPLLLTLLEECPDSNLWINNRFWHNRF